MHYELKNNLHSFQMKLLLSIGSIFLLFAVCFSVYQYKREKEYKIDIMHSRLQMYNYEMTQTLGNYDTLSNATLRDYVTTHNVEGLRVTVISISGNVLFDSEEAHVDSLANHLHRHEVQEALVKGNGYDIKRLSESTHETYFYSATRFGNVVVRAAVPYSAELTNSLQADHSFLWYGAVITLLLGMALYFNTRRIGRHVGYLREFARMAEEGRTIDIEQENRLPDDELGDISHTIIALYWKLRHSEEDKLRIKRQLTQNAAHELKTPAASIHGFLESILDNPDMPADKRQHFIERCYAQSERMSKLLLDMAALTKLDDLDDFKRRIDSYDNIIDVRTIIANVLDDTALQLQERGIKPHLSLPERILIPGDRSLIYSVFRNLVDNAIAYATDADTITITCGEITIGKTVFFSFVFSDNGNGVEPRHLPHLFERFYRVDKGRSRKLGGTGLGLAIVKNAVAVHGGTTTAEQTPGGGLTIRFTLSTVVPCSAPR